jgi:probable Rubsico expression protein CbbX
MNLPIIIFTTVSLAVFILLLAMAVKGAWDLRRKPGEEHLEQSKRPQPATRSKKRSSTRGSAKDQPIEPLDPDARITFAEERRRTDIDDILAGLDRDLVGLAPIKGQIQEIAALLLVDSARRRFGLDAPRPNLHMCFTGPPGTGKTTVALRMAELLHRLGYLEQGQLVHAMRDDLVGQYIGQTAPRTRAVLTQAEGGVLFIDEAYALYRVEDSMDYGREAVEILLQVMENERDKLVVILAGYKDRMDIFFTSNPGMRSRIAHHLDFAAYSIDELVAIGMLMLDRTSYYLSAEAELGLREYLSDHIADGYFANGRSVRNALERARLRHAHRLASDLHRSWSRDDLMRLERVDLFVEPAFPSQADDPQDEPGLPLQALADRG